MSFAHALAVSGALVMAIVAAARPAVSQVPTAALAGAELVTALRGGGFIIYLRHADTDHRQQDARPSDVADCTRQRNLTDHGREHARAIGAVIRALAIPIGRVLASPYCRTMETAVLAFGAAERADAVRDPGTAPAGSANGSLHCAGCRLCRRPRLSIL